MDRSAAILDRLLRLHPREIDLSLERVERLMTALGNPERRMPPAIHVAGTNGKGSTTAFMRAMLEAAGRSVHVYTSPHLVRFHERVRIGAPGGGTLVDEDELVDALLDVERINDGAPITQFEITTAAAFRLFADHEADYALIEVGLGGRLDATNVVARPLAGVITSISMDHEKFLGERIEGIAAEKAGILKRGVPAVIAPQTDAVMGVLEDSAKRLRAPLFVANQDWRAHAEQGRLVYEDEDGLLDLPAPRLVGRHQFTNAGTAIAALRRAGIAPSAKEVEGGLQAVDWPARLQRITAGKLVALLPPGAELWLDGGHNPGAGSVIAEAMADLEDRVSRPLILVVGMLTTKDPVGFLRPFAGLAREAIMVPIPGHAGREPEELAEAARASGLRAEPAPDVATALRMIGARTLEAPPRILICGSLYLAGLVLEESGVLPR
ncbi:MAG: bifunctional folylpolyglutamate synthase/dihydrofolate synthase [Bauldia sp.]|nr:bifunctional folylpolyglutamate synthase/dihydrofolate synthase [Bauldia sp.]